jgi:hypothetical protein
VLQFVFWVLGLISSFYWCIETEWWLSIVLALGFAVASWFMGMLIPVLVLNWAAGARFGAAAGIIGVLVTAKWENIAGAVLMNGAAWMVVRGQAMRLGID